MAMAHLMSAIFKSIFSMNVIFSAQPFNAGKASLHRLLLPRKRAQQPNEAAEIQVNRQTTKLVP